MKTNPVESCRGRVVAVVQRGLSRQIAKRSGVSYPWIMKFAAGEYRNPGALTLLAVEEALSDIEKDTAAA